MVNSRSLNDLYPKVRTMALQFIADCKDAGIDVLIYCTYRDFEVQEELYSRGRNSGGTVIDRKKVVTNAKPGQSWHNWRCAFDFVPMLYGKPQWKDRDLYLRCGLIAERIGLEWAGRWTGKLRETAHLQYTGGYTLADFRNNTFDKAKLT